MSSRRALWAAAVATSAVLGLTACGPDDTTAADGTPVASGSAAAPVSSAPTAAPTAMPEKKTTAPTATGAWDDCGGSNPRLPAGQKVVVVTKHATAVALYAKDGKFTCPEPDTGWWPVGEERTYGFAPGAKATLANDGTPQSVSLGRMAEHIGRCVDGMTDQPTCNSGKNYRITLDASGRITEITELWTV